jgi:O-antigen ligase
MTDTQAASAAVDSARRPISVWQLIVAVACLIAGYWFMAFATNRAWLYLPSIVLQALAVGLAVWALTQGQRTWPWIVIIVVAGVVALLTVIALFFAALFSCGG